MRRKGKTLSEGSGEEHRDTQGIEDELSRLAEAEVDNLLREVEVDERSERIASQRLSEVMSRTPGVPDAARDSPRSWIAAAAILLITAAAIWGIWVTARTPAGGELDDTSSPTLAPSPSRVSPVGEVDAWSGFSWNARRPVGGWFELHIDDATSGENLIHIQRLEDSRWTPSAAELDRLTDHLSIRVTVFHLGRATEVLEGTCRLSSP